MWANSRRRYDVGYGVKTLDDLHAVIAFFEARLGRLYGFRFKDFADFKSCAPGATVAPTDQALGTGDGATTAFQLAKTYASGPASWPRTIKSRSPARCASRSTAPKHAASPSTPPPASSPSTAAPAHGAALTAGFEFDAPVRFDTDQLSINLANFTPAKSRAFRSWRFSFDHAEPVSSRRWKFRSAARFARLNRSASHRPPEVRRAPRAHSRPPRKTLEVDNHENPLLRAPIPSRHGRHHSVLVLEARRAATAPPRASPITTPRSPSTA